MDELETLTVEELKMVKFQLIGELQLLQQKCRKIDKIIRKKLKDENS